MKQKIAASRYAKALLLLGQSENKVDEYGEELRGFFDAFRLEKETKRVLLSPVFDAGERKRVVRNMARLLKLSGVVTNFLQLLIDKERMGELADIVGAYREMSDEINGRVRVKVHSAAQIQPDLVGKIRGQMQKMLKKEAVLEIKIQPELIGGLVAKINNIQIDGSIRNQIVRLREKLESALGVA
jgi:F-type H+-transporting ATPase subunit delta